VHGHLVNTKPSIERWPGKVRDCLDPSAFIWTWNLQLVRYWARGVAHVWEVPNPTC